MTLRIIGSKTLLGVGVAGVLGVAALAGAAPTGDYWAGNRWTSPQPQDQRVATRRGPDLLAQVDARPANWKWISAPACLYGGGTAEIC